MDNDKKKPTDEKEKDGYDGSEASAGDTLKNLNLKTLINNEAEFFDEISEFFEENELAGALTIEEIDDMSSEIKHLRRAFKRAHRDLKDSLVDYDTRYGARFDEQCKAITEYITMAKIEKKKRLDDRDQQRILEKNKEMKAEETKEHEIRKRKVSQEKRISEIKAKELDEKIKQIESCCRSVDDLGDDEIMEVKSNAKALDNELRDLRDMRDKFETLISDFDDKERLIKELAEKYKKINDTVLKHKDKLKTEIKKRELEDYKLKAAANLNVELPKFNGTDYKIDIYSFQTKFEEEHSRLPKTKCVHQLKEKFLTGAAKEMVRLLEDIDEIWKVLKEAFGDPRALLSYELESVKKLGPLARIKDNQELAVALSKLANAMENLGKTAEKHNIQYELYNSHSEGLIYEIIGDSRVDRFLEKQEGRTMSVAEEWKLLKDFIQEEARRKSKMALKMNKTTKAQKKEDVNDNKSYSSSSLSESCGNPSTGTIAGVGGSSPSCRCQVQSGGGKGDSFVAAAADATCWACGGSNCENNGNVKFEYVKCKVFRELTCSERLTKVRNDKSCFQCLQHHSLQKECKEKEFVCKNEFHKRFNKQMHVLVCKDHQEDEENKKLIETYKIKIFQSKENIPKNFVTSLPVSPVYKVGGSHIKEPNMEGNDAREERAIFMLQRIKVIDPNGEEKIVNLFYDNGCGESNSRKKVVSALGSKAREITPGPLHLFGVGGVVVEAKHGEWELKLPLADGEEATISGLCLDQITHKFPEYKFDAVKQDISEYCRKNGIDETSLPQLPKVVGGETDIMIGSQYRKYFPVEILRLPSGLSLCESKFVSADGTRGVLCGPHASFTEIEKEFASQYSRKVYNSYRLHEVELGTPLKLSLNVLGFKTSNDLLRNMNGRDQSNEERLNNNILNHKAVKYAGTVCDYRCVECRGCRKCLDGEGIENVSLRDEAHQHVVDNSVEVDTVKRIAVARLPIIEENPQNILVPNGKDCLRIFETVRKQLDKDKKSKSEVVEFLEKLHKLGYVEYVANLSADQQKELKESPIQNFITWHCVWNKNSLSTPCCMVFNASYSSYGRRPLNSILAKGMNNMNSLLEILLRWSTHPKAFHADIHKMYNSVLLHPSDWCYQRFWWQDGLDSSNPVVEMVVKTIIYGVKSSGNQAERALRLTATKMEEVYPKAADIVKRDIYVDDCMSGDISAAAAREAYEDINQLLRHGGFSTKGCTFSGEDPPESLTEDGISINVAGMKWLSKRDKVQLCCGDLVFGKKKQGKPSPSRNGSIPEEFSRKECAGNVAGIFDLKGNVAPIVGGLKVNLRQLSMRKLHWDDIIPEDLRQMWTSKFEMIQELANITFKRCVIPDDALNLDIDTLEFGDASDSLACAAVYARVKRKNGQYSCQLLFARTKLLPLGTSTPRGELAAAELNATTGFVVRRALGKYQKGYYKFTDSQIVLCWINCQDKPLKQWPRARVIEINRLSSRKRWWFIPGPKNIADIGTRERVQIKDVLDGSEWREGYEWMRQEEKDFPMMSVECISFPSIREQVNAEMHKNGPILEAIEVMYSEPAQNLIPITYLTFSKLVPECVGERYKFSKYLIDPNKYRLKRVVRLMALVKRFIRKMKTAVKKRKLVLEEEENRKCLKTIPRGLNECEDDAIIFSDTELMSALEYFYRKATQEIKEFRNKRDYINISEDVDGILYYKGRILLEQCVSGVKDMCDVMVDLSCRTFWVPLVDAASPLAYSIANEVHWHSKEARHTGIEKTLRYTLQYAHILEGRELLSKIRKSCRKCRALLKEQLKVVMGPVSKHNLNVAPAFYVTLVDLVGHFESYHGANRRTKLKLWAIVFCCATTGAIDIKVMESYTTSAFVLGFKRFCSRSGFPKILLPDQGSQLLKGCGDAKLTFRDIKSQLNTEYGVEFSPCPAGAHYMHGRVERKIRQVRESLERSAAGQRLSTIGWETVFAEIGNCINDLPIGLAHRNVDLGNLDLLTPNRLLLGRNNARSPAEPVELTGSHDRIIDANNEIFKIWFKCWLTEYVPELMKQQKWFKGDRELTVGDIVLFKKAEKELECHYKYGRIKELKHSQDNIARSAIVEYQNAEESVPRTTLRGIRELILIQHVDEVGIMEELNEAAKEG